MRLATKVALITGGTSGIGRSTALLFAREGARIVITGRDPERGAQVVDDITRAGGEARFVPADITSNDDCQRAVAKAVSAFGRIDVLFNNAGVFVAGDVTECTEHDWDLQLDVNLKGTYLMSAAVVPVMLEGGGGSIVNNSSDWGLVGGERAVAYCAAKGGVVTMTKAMALDHASAGIRVNCICPGDTVTPMEVRDAEESGMTWDDYVVAASARPLGRMAQPDEIAQVALFLASDEASFVTGVALPVDGGILAG